MTKAERYKQAESLFDAALKHVPAERAAFLNAACASDPELRAEVETLLAAHEQSGFLDVPAYAVAAEGLIDEMARSRPERLGAYRLLDKLGAGGMGEVYLAEDTRLRRRVAVKLLPPEFTGNAERVHRFEREARAVSALNHPNIITIHEIGQAKQLHFIVTEYVAGQTLRQRLAGQRLKPNEALEVALQIATALQAAHEAGIVHRDIKPENIMLRCDGLVKVLDFGLAKLTERPAAAPDSQSPTMPIESTASGMVLGTPRYMSPEQARGLEVDACTDIFSLGVVLYEMLSGVAPFTGATSMDVLAAILDKEPAALSALVPSLPPGLEHIVNRALRKQRAERYQSAAEMLSELKSLREGLAFASQLNRLPQPEINAAPAVATAEQQTQRDTAEQEQRTTVGSFFSRQRKPLWLGGALLLALATALALLVAPLSRKSPSGPAVARANWRLSSGSGVVLGTAWSPDGKFIASTSNQSGQSGNCDIWLYPLDGSGEPLQVSKEPGNEFVNDWSPDGRKLLFTDATVHSYGQGIFVMPAFGGPAQKLNSFGAMPRWSPDGSQILFQSHWQIFVPILARLYLINPDGTALREFRPDFTRQFSSILRATWHPDGKRITLLGTHLKHGFGLWTIPLAGGAPIRSDREPAVERRMNSLFTSYVSFEWAPSGEQLFLLAKAKGPWNVWRVQVDPATLRWVDGPERLTASDHEDWAHRLSPDGKRLGYTMHSGFERAWAISFDALTGKLKGEEKMISPKTGAAFGFDLSVDGRKLIYRYHPGAWDELREYSFDTDKSKLLARFEKYTYVIGPWSADGNRLALRRVLRINPRENLPPEAQYIWLPAGGGEEHPITSPVDPRIATGRSTDWSRDGQWLLEISNSHQERKGTIRRLPLSAAPQAETKAQEVTSSTERFFDNARFSPDGRWVTFNSWQPQEGNEGTVYVVPVGGGAWIPITDSKEWVWNDRPRWSPDGRIIYFISARAAGINVWGRRFDPVAGQPTGAAFQVTNSHDPCKTGRVILVRDSGFGVARDRLVLPLISLSDLSTWIMEDVDK